MAIDLKNLAKESIRWQLMLSLLLPLLGLEAVSATVAYNLAVNFANEAYDRELVNTADSVGARLRRTESGIWVDLPPAAQAILHYNKKEKVYYQVLQEDGTRISGDAIIPGPALHLEAEQPILRYGVLNQKPIRIARIRVTVPNDPEERTVLVQVAETLNSRSMLAQQILLSIVIPQIALICLGAGAVWLGVARSLNPLKRLTELLAQRSPDDLTQVSETLAPVEVRPLVRALNDLLSRLKVDIESQKRFVANSAHQFRTPLAALRTYIYCAKRLPSDQEMNSILDKIDLSTERMSHLSKKLLALAKAEPANRFFSQQEFDLNDLASEVTAAFTALAARKNISLSFAGSDGPAIIKGDMDNLRELAANLVENAVVYAPNSGKVSVSIHAGDAVELRVVDNGPGIPVAEREHVFERFYRGTGVRESGSGLGLAIVRDIALAHEASVSIEEPLIGGGVSVRVLFKGRSAERS
ncbi:MAG: sensor histidine kinase N-terminal domain-containing protein [Candidatus Obscuribacterales bacterium]|nr:sensor histidine kinase N-terminal domain-containing protein [Candidatus Obscuribacterales bacterium]